MTDYEANEKRLIAAEIIRQLWESGNVSQLTLLKDQIDVSLKEICKIHSIPEKPKRGRWLGPMRD